MPTIFKTHSTEFKSDSSTVEDFSLKTLLPRLSVESKAKHLIFDIRQLDPGKYSFPYHFHRNSEELMYVISGTFTLRSPKGLEVVNQGELVFCEEGMDGLHQFYNHTDKPCIYLDIRTDVGIDVAEYPDSGKINILPEREIYDKDLKVPYYKGEESIKEIWERLKNE